MEKVNECPACRVVIPVSVPFITEKLKGVKWVCDCGHELKPCPFCGAKRKTKAFDIKIGKIAKELEKCTTRINELKAMKANEV